MRLTFLCSFRRLLPVLPVAAAFLLSPRHASAQADAVHASQAPSARAVRFTGSMTVDGRLTESHWTSAPPITHFTQRDPLEGSPVSEATDVRILFDNDAIYVGARLSDRHPISTRLGRRDASFQDSDQFGIAFDSYHDHLTAFRFAVNPSEVKRDEVISGGGFGGAFTGGGGGNFGGGDATWDPVWDVQTTVTDSGWVVEMRIPFSQLRFSRADVQTWGLQVERRIARSQELASFAFTPKFERGGVARYGHLTGLQGLVAQGRVEALPYVFGRADYRAVPQNPSVTFVDPYRSGSDLSRNVGGDLKFRVTSNFTLDATVNPDFGQVELDPAVVNLTAFETRFEERRPFFVEGASIFRFGFGGGMMGGGGGGAGGGAGGGGQIVYSRRIGRSPQVGVPSNAVYSDVPETATILGAAKLTGRTPSGWSIGILEAVTGRETAAYVDASMVPGRAVVEPLTNYVVGRVRRDLRNSGTRVGAVFTGVHRDLADSTLIDRLRAEAYTGGLDITHEWADRDWSLSGNIVSSSIGGSEAVMLRAQRSSARYYQRPDAGHLAIDSAATSMTGYSGSLNVGKRAGAWTGFVNLSAVSPGYEINDLGFQTASDRMSASSQVTYTHTRPGMVFREWKVDASHSFTRNYDTNPVSRRVSSSFDYSLQSYWSGSLDVAREGGTLNDRLTRGGPLARDPIRRSISASLQTDPRRAYTMRVNAEREEDTAGGQGTQFELSLGWRPADNWEIRLGPEFGKGRSAAQYVTSVGDATATSTYGRRYLFAGIEQTEVSLSTRVNVTFTPKVTLELYAQPLLATGDYAALKELRAPRTFDFNVYGTDAGTIGETAGVFTIDPDAGGPASSFTVNDRDFTALELRGNAVLRWEFRPGSTLFAVWQQRRSAEYDAFDSPGRAGQFDFGRDARGLVGLKPENVFIVKMSYWLNP